MKIAVIGSTPAALLAAKHFDELGAGVVLFCDANFARQHELQLGQFTQRQRMQFCEVLRVQKCSLAANEEIKNRSRMADLFRVVFKKDPSQTIEQMKQDSPELYEKLNDKMLASLQGSLEDFEDFDVVINASSPKKTPNFMGPGAPAIGEQRWREFPEIHYGSWQGEPLRGEVAIVGSGQTAQEILSQLLTLDEKIERIFVISTEANPLAHIEVAGLQSQLELLEQIFSEQVQDFEKRLEQWRNLEDYIRAKYPRPDQPIPKIVFFAGHHVSAIDRLVDKERFFLTCERADFRECLKQPENAVIPLKTIGVDRVFIATGYRLEPRLECYLAKDEPGYYEITSHCSPEVISQCEQDVLKFFSKT